MMMFYGAHISDSRRRSGELRTVIIQAALRRFIPPGGVGVIAEMLNKLALSAPIPPANSRFVLGKSD
jgi:hypothetical protein